MVKFIQAENTCRAGNRKNIFQNLNSNTTTEYRHYSHKSNFWILSEKRTTIKKKKVKIKFKIMNKQIMKVRNQLKVINEMKKSSIPTDDLSRTINMMNNVIETQIKDDF